MKPLKKAGFTIVETMLFLGISGLLVLGILVGTGSSINIQRYRDSVTSFRSFLQQQYSDVANTSNENNLNDCYGDATTNNPRGQSNCVILGRLIKSIDGEMLSIDNILGYSSTVNSTASNDVDAFKEYNIKVSPIGNTTYKPEWGSQLRQLNNEEMKFSMLILRSPSSGVTRTFIDSENAVETDRDILNLVNPDSLDVPVTICLDSNGLLDGGSKMAVRVNANATGASSVETLGDDSGCQ